MEESNELILTVARAIIEQYEYCNLDQANIRKMFEQEKAFWCDIAKQAILAYEHYQRLNNDTIRIV